MPATPGSNQEKVNKAMPVNAKVKMGDIIAALVAQVNLLTTKHNALVAKLDLDAGVTDTTYTSLTGVPATTVKSLET